MTRNNKLKTAFYLVLFGLTCCFIFQFYYNYKSKETQISSIKLQELLSLSDDVSTNMGSIQHNFRSYLFTSSIENLNGLKTFQALFESTLATTAALSSAYPTIHSHVEGISNLYKREQQLAYSLLSISSSADKEAAIRDSEKRMEPFWSHLWDFKLEVKDLLKENNSVSLSCLETMQIVRVVSILLLGSLVVTIYLLYSSFRKVSYKASFSSKSALSNQLLLMKSVLDATTTLMYIIDVNGRYLFVNKAFLHFFELKESEVLGKTFHELDVKKDISFENLSIITDPTDIYLEHEEVAYADGQKLYFFTRKFPIKNNKNEIFASGVVCRNITERILNEEGLKKSRHDAEQAKLTQEQFMANISHEIRTPMNGIIGMANLLSNTVLDEQQEDYLQTIQQSSRNLMVLINDILDFSKIEAGKLELEHISFKITDILEQITTPLKTKVREKNLEFNINVDHKVPSKIVGDPLRLNQILTNILSNAIKFTPKGAINLNVSAISYNAPLVKIIFKIEDTGIGIPEDRINYIFQSFTQTSLDITRKFGGTGLGLAIVKQLVDLHKGNISVESQENKGSVFTIEIPYKSVVIGKRTVEENSKFELLKGKKILIVEDNFINQKVIVQTLKNAGLETSLSDNGFTALEMLKHNTFDLVIMDIQMPEIDGCETTMRIREELHLNIPIIAMTASAMQDDRDKCKKAGMNEYISKPFVTEDLLEKMLLFIN
jgi:PAS domain S-box-containing protein